MARRGRKRKDLVRRADGRPANVNYEPAISEWTKARRQIAVGEHWNEPNAGWLIGVWYIRGELIQEGEAPTLAGPRRDAALSYFKAIHDMQRLVGLPPCKDSLGRFQPGGAGIELSDERQRRMWVAYDERYSTLRACGRDVMRAVHAALEDDTGASRERVIVGLQALVDGGLT